MYLYIYIYTRIYVRMLDFLDCETTSSFSIFLFVRINVTDIYPLCNRTHSQGHCSVCPCLDNSVRIYKWCFIIIYCFIYQQDLISNSRIVLDLIKVFVDDVFFYLRFLALTYISPICHIFVWENHVSAKHQLDWILVVNYMIRRSYKKG